MGEAKQRMLAGELYVSDDPELIEDGIRARRLTALYDEVPYHGRRTILLELLGAVGEDVFIRPPLRVDYGQQLRVGAGTFVNYGLVALDCAPITIGAACQVGPYVQLLTAAHPLDPVTRRAGWEYARPIMIGDNVWLGGGAIVCPGVSIGHNTVVGAGAVVVRDLPPDVVAVGNPARVMKQL